MGMAVGVETALLGYNAQTSAAETQETKSSLTGFKATHLLPTMTLKSLLYTRFFLAPER